MSTSHDPEVHGTAPQPPSGEESQATPREAEPVPLPQLQSFGARLNRLRVSRSLSKRELSERAGLRPNQYDHLARGGADPTLTLLLSLANALDVTLAELLKSNSEPPSMVERVQTLLHELRWRRARMARLQRRFNRLLDRVREEFVPDTEALLPTEKVLEDALASLQRNETLRAWAGQYARLVLEYCQGNKRKACRVLGISYHTLQAHLRYRLERHDATTIGSASTTEESTQSAKPSDKSGDNDGKSSEASQKDDAGASQV